MSDDDDIAEHVALPLLRGTTDGAMCMHCPFARDGEPSKPVLSEYPEDPAWLLIAEGPGFNEVRWKRPLVGNGGQVIDKVLAKIGRPRRDIFVTQTFLCMAPQGAEESAKEAAAAACKPRLLGELAQFPGKPVMTLGALAARNIIPQATLDKIDPPDAPKQVRKQQKLRQQPVLKNAIARRKAIDKIAKRRLATMIAHHRKALKIRLKVEARGRPDEAYLQHEVSRVHAKLELKAREDAIKEYELKAKERAVKKLVDATKPKKKTKPKKIKITDIVGTLFDIDIDGTGERPLIPTIHPMALLQGGGGSIGGSHTPDMAFVNLYYDAGKVDALSKGKDIRLKLNYRIEVQDPARAVELFLDIYRSALEEGEVSFDLETYVEDPDRHHALMAYVAKIKVLGVSTNHQQISVAWDLLPGWCMSLLQQLFMSVRVWYHNGLYDATVFRAHGFAHGEWDDTLLAHHAAFPGNSHKLQVVTTQFYGVGPWKSEYRNQEETPETLAAYNAKDTGATHALRAPLQLWIKRTGTQRVYDLDKKMADIASRMHLAGMPVNREENSALLATFSTGVKDARAEVEGVARDPKLREQIWHHLAIAQAGKKRKLDPDDFEARYNVRLSAMKLDPDWKWKISAGKHIAALLQAMDVGLYQTTTGGEISTKKEVLEALTNVPIVRKILDFRENDKLLSTFVWQIFDRVNAAGEIQAYGYADANDRIHPIWNVHRISGRWASQWPVVSNVPKDKWLKLIADALLMITAGYALPDRNPDKAQIVTLPSGIVVRVNKDGTVSKMTRPNLRRQIRARPGRKFVGFDFGQIEARVIALISGDPFLCAIFAEGRDPHIECSRIIWPHFDGLDSDTRKQLRENVKNIEYGAMYMAQLDTLHKTMLKAGNYIKIEDLAVAINKLLIAMAGVVKWQHQTIAQASRPPFEIKDFVIGRRRIWPMGQAEGPEAVNYGVQTAAAAIMNTGMARMAERLPKYKEADPIAQIHDAAVFEVWEDDAVAFAKDVDEAFTQWYERDGRKIPFPVETKIGDTWAQV